eukprot:366461-Chlamydomonas_euryale.AAC.7
MKVRLVGVFDGQPWRPKRGVRCCHVVPAAAYERHGGVCPRQRLVGARNAVCNHAQQLGRQLSSLAGAVAEKAMSSVW